jgi:formate hydrogenlyase transcriptional activator
MPPSTVGVKPLPILFGQPQPCHHQPIPFQEPDRLVSLLIKRFARLPGEQTLREVCAMLRDVVLYYGFDGCGLVPLSHQSGGIPPLPYCNSDGAATPPASFPQRELFPWTHSQLSQDATVCFATPAELPEDAGGDRLHYETAGLQSVLAIPLQVPDSVPLCLMAHGTGPDRQWEKQTLSLLRLVGEILVMALGQKLQEENQPELPLERLTCEISAKLLNAAPDEVHQEITASLEQLRELLGFDRVGLGALSAGTGELRITHFCYGAGIGPVPENVNVSPLFPWATEKLLRGETVYFASLAELPAEASVDRQSWQALGARMNLTLPIRMSGAVSYLLIASQIRSPRELYPPLFPKLRLLGEIFASTLLRCQGESSQREADEEIQRLKEKLSEKLQSEAEDLQVELASLQRHEEIVGESAALAKTMALTEQVATTDTTVLICGETGTGKELVAQAIHKLGCRRGRPMVKVNCASLPAALVESELFGREKGAYTGALTRQAGRFELADGGTIFLDEIAEISLELQAKLLRVLQEGQFERLGSGRTIQVDVRVIAATNRNLIEEVRKGNFREDLYYRLNVFQIVVPPLRDRVEDIPLLVWSFVREFADKMGKKINKISRQDMSALQSYPWPGNVRELRNVLEHAVIVSNGDKLQVRLPEMRGQEVSGMRTLEEYEVMHIKDALRLAGWRIKGNGGAASLLGLNPSTLYSRMQKYGISNRPGRDEISP